MKAQPKQPVQGPAAPKGKSQFALGRLPAGVMNKTEERFLHEVIEPMMLAGELVWWDFEGIKLRLAPNTHLTIDFAVMYADRRLELIDVKGGSHLVEEDSNAKLKIAAHRFPFPIVMVWPVKKTWHREQVGRE